MNPGDIIALIGIIIVGGGAGLTAYVSLTNRITRMETFIEVYMKQILHSDDDHLGLDEYIDRLGVDYASHHYDLTDDQWEDFFRRLKSVPLNEKATKLEKASAKMFLHLCRHKLMRSGRLERVERETSSNQTPDVR